MVNCCIVLYSAFFISVCIPAPQFRGVSGHQVHVLADLTPTPCSPFCHVQARAPSHIALRVFASLHLLAMYTAWVLLRFPALDISMHRYVDILGFFILVMLVRTWAAASMQSIEWCALSVTFACLCVLLAFLLQSPFPHIEPSLDLGDGCQPCLHLTICCLFSCSAVFKVSAAIFTLYCVILCR